MNDQLKKSINAGKAVNRAGVPRKALLSAVARRPQADEAIPKPGIRELSL